MARRKTNYTLWLAVFGIAGYVFRDKLSPLFNQLKEKINELQKK